MSSLTGLSYYLEMTKIIYVFNDNNTNLSKSVILRAQAFFCFSVTAYTLKCAQLFSETHAVDILATVCGH